MADAIQQVETVRSDDSMRWNVAVNALLADGWRLQSTAILPGSGARDIEYVAILVREVPRG